MLFRSLGLRNALIDKDSVALTKLLANDASYGHSNGLVQTKAQLIRDIVSRVQDYKKIEPADMHIRVYDNVAIVNMFSFVNMNYQGKPLDLSMNVLLVWLKIGNEWKLEARQSVVKK